MCYRVEVRADCAGGVERHNLAHLLMMLGPGAIGVRGTPDGWTTVLHFHAPSAESAMSMAVTRLAGAACNAHLPTPFSLTCEATPHVDNPSGCEQRPFLSWSASSPHRSRSSVPSPRLHPRQRTRVMH